MVSVASRALVGKGICGIMHMNMSDTMAIEMSFTLPPPNIHIISYVYLQIQNDLPVIIIFVGRLK